MRIKVVDFVHTALGLTSQGYCTLFKEHIH